VSANTRIQPVRPVGKYQGFLRHRFSIYSNVDYGAAVTMWETLSLNYIGQVIQVTSNLVSNAPITVSSTKINMNLLNGTGKRTTG
jgi:hypothetical protein